MHNLFHPNPIPSVTIRFDKKNLSSLAALQAILLSRGIDVNFSSRPRDGIMIYSLATPQATDIYRERSVDIHCRRPTSLSESDRGIGVL